MTSPESNIHRINVVVSKKEGVPDPEVPARTAELQGLGFESAKILSISQLIQLDIKAASSADAAEVARQASEQFLANPVYQQYEIFDSNKPLDNTKLSG